MPHLRRRSAASDAASYALPRDAIENHVLDGTEQFGLRLRRGVIELQLGAGGWQALTDAGTWSSPSFCSSCACSSSLLSTAHAPAAGGRDAHVNVRRLALRITARAASDAPLVRRIDTWCACATTRSRAPAPPEEPNTSKAPSLHDQMRRGHASRSRWPC